MIVSYILQHKNGSPKRYACDEPSECPICKHAIKPLVLSQNTFLTGDGSVSFAVTYVCQNCFFPFLAFFCPTSTMSDEGQVAKRVFVAPIRHAPVKFDPKIEALSPSFVEIYNQASAAEERDLDQIAGIGYRKALEFLVKDFCIHQTPDEEEAIKSKLLGRVIAEYIQEPRIKTLAEKATWIGNDETHYIRKHEDRDINDMKNFIQAMVYFAGMELIVEDADSMSPA